MQMWFRTINACLFEVKQIKIDFKADLELFFDDLLMFGLKIEVHISDNACVFLDFLCSPFLFFSGKQCMGLVDLDRAWAAERCNYSVQVTSMEPESCSPKNNMFVGTPV